MLLYTIVFWPLYGVERLGRTRGSLWVAPRGKGRGQVSDKYVPW